MIKSTQKINRVFLRLIFCVLLHILQMHFVKTVGAFSNYDGGEIFFGISENGNIKGLSDGHPDVQIIISKRKIDTK